MTVIDAPQTDRHIIPSWGEANDDEKHWALMLLIDEDDLARAETYWRRHANSMFAGLIAHDGFTFDEQNQAYVRDNGREVDEDELRWLFLAFLGSAADEMELEAGKMANGDMSISDWQDMQARATKDLYITSESVGVGGVSRLTQEDLQDVAGVKGESGLSDALDRLQRFAKAVEKMELTMKEIVNRAGLYAKPAYGIEQEARRSSHIRAKDETGTAVFVFERNILDDEADHCRECPELTERGWQPIGSMPPPGFRECLFGCRCYLEFATVNHNL